MREEKNLIFLLLPRRNVVRFKSSSVKNPDRKLKVGGLCLAQEAAIVEKKKVAAFWYWVAEAVVSTRQGPRRNVAG